MKCGGTVPREGQVWHLVFLLLFGAGARMRQESPLRASAETRGQMQSSEARQPPGDSEQGRGEEEGRPGRAGGPQGLWRRQLSRVWKVPGNVNQPEEAGPGSRGGHSQSPAAGRGAGRGGQRSGVVTAGCPRRSPCQLLCRGGASGSTSSCGGGLEDPGKQRGLLDSGNQGWGLQARQSLLGAAQRGHPEDSRPRPEDK